MSKFDKLQQYEQVGEIVSIYQRPGSRNWYAYYRLDGRVRRQSLQTRYRGKASKRALELENKIQAGQDEQPVKPPLIADAVDQYLGSLSGKQRSTKTIGKYRHCLKLVLELAAARGFTRLNHLDHQFIDAFCNLRVRQGKQPKTVKNDVVTIRQLINFAVKRGLLLDDPLKNLELPKAPLTPQPCWTPEEVDQILGAALPRYRAYFTILWLTGARAGEAAWLTWSDVDFEKWVIHIRGKSGWRPKTGDQRVIPISDMLRATLAAQPKQCLWVFTAKPTAKCPQAGRQVDMRRALSHLKTVVKRLGLPDGHLHTFRHSFISHALTSGVPEAVVRRWVGHVDARIMRVYTHVADQISQQAMKGLFAAGGEPRSESQAAS